MQLPGEQHLTEEVVTCDIDAPSSPVQPETHSRLSKRSKYHRSASPGEVSELQHHVDARRAANDPHAVSHGIADFKADHPEFTKYSTLHGYIDNANMQTLLLDGKKRHDKTRESVVPEEMLTKIRHEVAQQNLKTISGRISSIQAGARKHLSTGYPQLEFSETWVKAHFADLLHPPHDPLQSEKKSPEVVLAEFKHELEQVYDWRLEYCKSCLGGNLHQEFRSWDYLANFDEFHMPLLPLNESNYWHHQGYTAGIITFASDRMRAAPIVIDKGLLQGAAANPVLVDVDGVQYPVYYWQNDTHKMNEFLYNEYLKCAFIPNLGSLPKPASHIAAFVVACLLDDDYKSHRTEAVTNTLESAGVRHILVPNTKIGQPNDFKINHLLEQGINRQLHDWCAERRRQEQA